MLIYDWIEPARTGLFVRTATPGHGRVAALFPVPDRDWEPIDTVAWFVDRPGVWWTASAHGTVLGLPSVHLASGWSTAPLALHSTPDLWHRAGGRGACILDWTRPGDVLDDLCGCASVACDSEALATRLAATLKRALKPRLRITIAAPPARAPAPGSSRP